VPCASSCGFGRNKRAQKENVARLISFAPARDEQIIIIFFIFILEGSRRGELDFILH